jgi:protein Tob/BTG
MLQEVSTAVLFIASIIKQSEMISDSQLIRFMQRLCADLQFRFQNHWFVHAPERGSAFRCLRNTTRGGLDPRFVKAAIACDISGDVMSCALPSEFLLWVDPREVSYKIGEFGPIMKLTKQEIQAMTLAFHEIAITAAATAASAAASQGQQASINHITESEASMDGSASGEFSVTEMTLAANAEYSPAANSSPYLNSSSPQMSMDGGAAVSCNQQSYYGQVMEGWHTHNNPYSYHGVSGSAAAASTATTNADMHACYVVN